MNVKFVDKYSRWRVTFTDTHVHTLLKEVTSVIFVGKFSVRRTSSSNTDAHTLKVMNVKSVGNVSV